MQSHVLAYYGLRSSDAHYQARLDYGPADRPPADDGYRPGAVGMRCSSVARMNREAGHPDHMVCGWRAGDPRWAAHEAEADAFLARRRIYDPRWAAMEREALDRWQR